MDQNIDSFGFDQIQLPRYPDMNEEVFQAKGNLMKSIQTFLEKFNCISFGKKPKVLLQAWEKFFAIQHAQPEDTNELFQKLLEDLQIINEELAEYINSPSWNRPTFYNNDEDHSFQYKEYLENSSNAIAASNFNQEKEGPPQDSDIRQLVREECETESDKVIESSVKNLVPIPSEYEVTSDDESECDVPIKDESFPVFTTFSNPIFDDNDDFTSSDDELLSDEDVSMEDFKEISGELMPTSIVNEERIKREYEEYISLIEKLLAINSFPRLLENFYANTIVDTLPSSSILIEDSDSLRKEIDIFTSTDNLLPSGIESDDYDSEGDIHFLEELLSNDSIPLPENESSYFDHHDDSSFPRPPPEPPDVEFFFDFEPNSEEVISDELIEDECFDPG
nr:hypothetical protein [Tanacetum cinerariifolium]